MTNYKKEAKVNKNLKHIQLTPFSSPPEKISLWAQARQYLSILIEKIQGKSSQDLGLQGRIHAFKFQAEKCRKELERIKQEFSGEQTLESYTFIDAIIDPLLIEFDTIQKAWQADSVAMQAKFCRSCGSWLDRAIHWISVYDKSHERSDLINAVIHHLVGEALLKVQRDIEIVQNYQFHRLSQTVGTQSLYNDLMEKADKPLSSHLEALHQLKMRPQVISFAGLQSWREEIDRKRQKHFEEALEIIDGLLDSVQEPASRQKHHYQPALVARTLIASLFANWL